ncbi:MAG: DUF5343 domain-containing protein [Pseudomonas sp.]|nr:DUF5343 domain-containing protein [Pseudomonas sp.]
MAINLPYLASPGSIKTALEKIRTAATPDRLTKDFVTTKLQIKGGTGSAIIPFLKKIGLVGSDGTPTDLYKQFRNQSSGGRAISDAIKIGYRELLQANEYFYELGDRELLALIVQVTGSESESTTAKSIYSTLKNLKTFANFEDTETPESAAQTNNKIEIIESQIQQAPQQIKSQNLGLNLSYTINLNLPATSDQAVFNAIFRSLKEHLLSNE